MGKIKIIFFIILAFIIYKGVVAFKNFEIGVSDRVAEIEKHAGFEKEGEVIGLMMYLGDPPELKEHLFTKSRSICFELNGVAEENSIASQADYLYSALTQSGLNFVVIAPNNDPGRNEIFKILNRLSTARFRIIPSMRFNYFSELMKNSSLIS